MGMSRRFGGPLVVAGVTALVLALATPVTAGANGSKPTITGASASPTTVTLANGTVTLSAVVTGGAHVLSQPSQPYSIPSLLVHPPPQKPRFR